MSNVNTACANCGNPTPTANLDADGHCVRCSNGRISASPPKPDKAPANVAVAARKGYDVSKLDRDQQISAKIPLEKFLAGNPGLAPSRQSADSSST